MTTGWHIAQLDVARAVAALDGIKAPGGVPPGFVRRLKSDSGNATDVRASDDPNFIVNLAVWESVEAHMVLRSVPAGHRSTTEEATARLRHLRTSGPTAPAFAFKRRYPPPGQAGAPAEMRPGPCRVGWA